MQTKLRFSKIIVFAQWTGLTSLCLTIGFSFYLNSAHPDGLFLIVSFMLVAILQWAIVLRRYLNNVAWWVYVSAMGFLLSFGVYYVLDQVTRPLWIGTGLINSTPTIEVIRNVIWGAIIGFTLGLAQWYVVLRNNKIRYAVWWVPANTFAYGICFGIALEFYTLAKSARWDAFFGGPLNMSVIILGAVLASVVVGAITGITIVWLLRDRIVEHGKDNMPHLSETSAAHD